MTHYPTSKIQTKANSMKWRDFINTAEGWWCRRNNPTLFDKLKKKYSSKIIKNSKSIKFYKEEHIVQKAKSMKWRDFSNTAEGWWCRRNNPILFDKLKKDIGVQEFKRNYTDKDLKNTVSKMGWSAFYSHKKGQWCKRNNPKLFKELKEKYQSSTFEWREKEYQREFALKISSFLKKNNLDFTLTAEKPLYTKGKFIGWVDFMLELHDYQINIPIEIKHDNSYWKNSEIANQVKKYNNSFSNNSLNTYIVSPNGRYGFSEKEFLTEVLEYLIKTDYITKPNALETIRAA